MIPHVYEKRLLIFMCLIIIQFDAESFPTVHE